MALDGILTPPATHVNHQAPEGQPGIRCLPENSNPPSRLHFDGGVQGWVNDLAEAGRVAQMFQVYCIAIADLPVAAPDDAAQPGSTWHGLRCGRPR